jgi:hypothetical protein
MRGEEFQRRCAHGQVDRRTIHARCIDASLGELVFPLRIALVDEDLVVDPAGNDEEVGVRNMLGGELGIFVGRRLRVPAPTAI